MASVDIAHIGHQTEARWNWGLLAGLGASIAFWSGLAMIAIIVN